jgi:hypothetical protein
MFEPARPGSLGEHQGLGRLVNVLSILLQTAAKQKIDIVQCQKLNILPVLDCIVGTVSQPVSKRFAAAAAGKGTNMHRALQQQL